MPSSPLLHIEHITRMEDVTSARVAAWERCLDEAGGSFFQSPLWVRAWWKYLSRKESLSLWFVCDTEDRVTAVLPGMVTSTRWWGKSMRAFMFIGGALNDVNDAVCVPDRRESLALLLDAIAHPSHEWDILHFKELPDNSFFLHTLVAHPAYQSHEHAFSVARPQIIKPPPAAASPASIPSLSKADINRRYNMLKRNGTVAIQFSHASEKTKQTLDDFSKMFQRRSDGTGYDSPFPDAAHKEFFAELASLQGGNYRAHIAQLSLRDTPISYIYWLETPTVRTYYANTFEPLYHQFSPSSILLRELIRDFFTTRHNVFDLGRGAMPYKLRFANNQVSNIQLIWARGAAPIRRWATRSAWRARPIVKQFPLLMRVLKNAKKFFLSPSL